MLSKASIFLGERCACLFRRRRDANNEGMKRRSMQFWHVKTSSLFTHLTRSGIDLVTVACTPLPGTHRPTRRQSWTPVLEAFPTKPPLLPARTSTLLVAQPRRAVMTLFWPTQRSKAHHSASARGAPHVRGKGDTTRRR